MQMYKDLNSWHMGLFSKCGFCKWHKCRVRHGERMQMSVSLHLWHLTETYKSKLYVWKETYQRDSCMQSGQFSTLQHTATHCNTLQHTATYYNTLQHTAYRSLTSGHSPSFSFCLSLSLLVRSFSQSVSPAPPQWSPPVFIRETSRPFRTTSFLGAVFRPRDPSLFSLYHHLEQNGAFGLVPEHAPGSSSQVFPGHRVTPASFQEYFSAAPSCFPIRHPLSSKKILVL